MEVPEDVAFKIVRAHKRIWGDSCLPIRVVPSKKSVYVAWSFDDESGSACEWDYSGKRIKLISEKEPSF